LTPTSLIAAALQSRGAYEAILDSGEAEVLPEELITPWQAVCRFYDTDENATRADPELVKAYAAEGLTNPKHVEQVGRSIDRFADQEISAANITEVLRLVALNRVRDALAHALATRQPNEQVAALMEEYSRLESSLGAGDEEDVLDWGEVLRSRVDPAGRIKVAPRAINEMLGGGLLPGHNVTVFARPEVGKTALAITMACGFARRGHRVLYVINEDAVQDLMVRAVMCSTGRTRADILADHDGTVALALKKGLGNLIMRELSPGSVAELERLIRQYKPNVLFVDQIRNLKVGKADNYTQGLDAAARGIRALGKRYGLVTVGLTQAGDSASGRAILEMGDIDSSNTGIPGAADVLIGMGVTEQLDRAGQRMLSFSKNKVSGQHGTVTVSIDTQISRVTSRS